MSDFDPDIKLLNEFEYSFANRSRWQIHGRSKPLLYPMDETGLHRVTTVQDLLQRNSGQNLGSTSSIRLQPVDSVAIQLNFTIGNESRPSDELKFVTSFSCSPFLDFGLIASTCLHDHGIKCGRYESCKTSKIFSSPPVWQFALLGKEPFMYDWPPRYHPVEAVVAESGALPATLINSGSNVGNHPVQLAGRCRSVPEHAFFSKYTAAKMTSRLGHPSLLNYRKKGRKLQVPVVAESTCDSTTQLDVSVGSSLVLSARRIRAMLPSLWEWRNTKLKAHILLPCKQIFCSDCVGKGSKVSCFQCDKRHTGQVIFSGAMESPFGKSAKIISSRALSTYQLLKQLQRVPGYNSPQTPSQESPQTVATKVARLSWGDQTPFWFNFIISTLNKADKQSRSSMTEILAIEKARSSNIHQLEALLPLLSKADFFNEKDFHQTQLLELISLSVNNVDSSRAQSHGCSPRVSTCLEALVDWMETESIGPDELLRCGVDLKLWHCPQKTPSLKCVARFLKQGGRSFLKDYGFNRGDLQMPVSRKVREMLLEDFISNGFHLNARDAHGRTILWTERQLTYMLLDNGARVDIPDNDGSTLLHALVAKQDPTSLQKNQGPLETLLNHQKGREAVNVRNRDGLTPYQLVLGIDAIHYWDIYTRLFDNAEADIGIVFPKGVYRDKLTYSLAKWQAEVGSVSAFRRPAAEERLLRARLAMSYS
ncbi:integral membrane protein [Colletotrichum asianum]